MSDLLEDLYDVEYPGELERVLSKLDDAEAQVRVLRLEAERLGGLPLNRRNWLKGRIQLAMRHLRDAEDYARFNMPAWPTADRIRAVHEKLTDEVINGSTNRPTPREQLRAFKEANGG